MACRFHSQTEVRHSKGLAAGQLDTKLFPAALSGQVTIPKYWGVEVGGALRWARTSSMEESHLSPRNPDVQTWTWGMVSEERHS